MNYLVQYGRSAFVGAFAAAEAFAHGTRVVVRGPRGGELGTVLCPAERFPGGPAGDILRAATPADDADAARQEARARELLDAATARADELGLPLTFLDAEIPLDGRSAVLHGLPWGECDADPLFAELAARFGLAVRLLDVSRTPVAADPTGCGKPGCGTDGGGCGSCGTEKGGCSSGSCSRGAVKSADDMSAYFRDLREKMEAAGLARTPLA